MELSRDISPELLAEMVKPMWYPGALAEIDWPTGVVYAHTGIGTVEYDGKTFLGLGEFAGISASAEQPGYPPQQATLSLTGPYADLLAEMTSEAASRPVRVCLVAFATPGGPDLAAPPSEIFGGKISGDALPPSMGDTKLSLTVTSGSHARTSGAIYHSDESHQVTYPGDTLFARNAFATAHSAAPPKW